MIDSVRRVRVDAVATVYLELQWLAAMTEDVHTIRSMQTLGKPRPVQYYAQRKDNIERTTRRSHILWEDLVGPNICHQLLLEILSLHLPIYDESNPASNTLQPLNAGFHEQVSHLQGAYR
jgi:hypothetical protein